MKAALVFLTALLVLAASPVRAQTQASAPPLPELTRGAEDIPEWRARWELARLLSYEKQYGEALAEYRKLLQQKPELNQARLEMAKVLFWSGRDGEAMKMLETLPKGELDAEARLALADLLIARKQYPEAEDILRAQLARFPDDQEARYRLAQLLSWQKRYQDSLEEYRRILAARPDDEQVRRKYAFVLIWAGQRQAAISELRRTLKATDTPKP